MQMTHTAYVCLMCMPSGSFEMQFDLQVGVGTIVVAKSMDAEVQSVFNMTVQVTDGTNFATTQVCKFFICTIVLPPTHFHLPSNAYT